MMDKVATYCKLMIIPLVGLFFVPTNLTAEQAFPAIKVDASKGRIYFVAFSPDGSKIATASEDGKIKLWKTSGELLGEMAADEKPRVIRFSPDAKFLVSGHNVGAIIFWDVEKFNQVAVLQKHSGLVSDLSFSPDGKLLASASGDDDVILWSYPKMEYRSTLKGHEASVYSLSFSSDGKLLASCGHDFSIKIWDIVSGKNIRTLHGKAAIASVLWSKDGRKLISSSVGGVTFWNAQNGEAEKQLKQEGFVWRLALSPDEQTLLATGVDEHTLVSTGGNIHIWHLDKSSKEERLNSGSKIISTLAWSPDGKKFASGSDDGILKIWTFK